MDRFRTDILLRVALPLLGSAILLLSCQSTTPPPSDQQMQDVITQQSENLTIVYSKQGNLSYRFTTPLMERYEMAREPYMEFRRGVDITTYNDSTQTIESTLTANYAIFLENPELWEAKGNVIAVNAEGSKLETEQLFWNQKTQRIYSNVDSKITQGRDVIIGEGFESDEQFEEYTIRRPKGRVLVNAATTPRDTTAHAGSPAPQ